MQTSNPFQKTFSALYYKDYRYFWIGQSLSTIGGMMQLTALSWYVYKISGSPFLLGLMGVFEFGPVLLLSLFAGVYVERYPKRTILLITQSLFLVHAFVLAVLVWCKVENYVYFAVLALIAGIVTSFDSPARQSYAIELVGPNDLTNAISLNSTTFNIARIIGPAIAGIVMKYVGIAECFLINGISFIPILIGLFMITTPPKIRPVDKNNKLWKEVKTGLEYTKNNIKILPTFLILAIICTFSMNANVVLPVFAKTVMLGDEATYTFLMSMMGVGSVGGALFMAHYGKDIRYPYFLVMIAVIICILQILTLVPLHHHTAYLATLLILIGFGNLCFLNRANSRIQLNTNDDYRGRVMSIYVLINVGSTPIGNSFTGYAMGVLGEKYGFFIDGLISLILVLTVLYIYRKHISKAQVVK